VIFFDTETRYAQVSDKEIEHCLRLGVACFVRFRRDGKADQQKWFVFESIPEFWDFVCQHSYSKSTLYLVAHNLAFDLQVVQGLLELPRRGYLLAFLYESGHTRIVKFGYPTKKFRKYLAEGGTPSKFEGKRWSKTIIAMDNCNLFAGSIERWGKSLGLPKLKMPHVDAPKEDWVTYCRRDVEVMVELWREWRNFLRNMDMGTFRITIGSQAFGSYRHRFMKHKIYIHTHESAISLERRAYFGGRCEAFRVGRFSGRFYKLDINSMYPYVMREFRYPSRLLWYTNESCDVQKLEQILERYGVIARVLVEIDEPVFPVRHDHRNIYPVGRFECCLNTPELVYALERSWIRRIEEMAVYRMRPIFVAYVNELYRLKVKYSRENDKLRRQLIKLLLNSLYGKFGQRGFEDSLIGTCDPNVYEITYGRLLPERISYKLIKAGGMVIKSKRCGEGFNSFVAIASHVTAYARMYLWSLILQAGRENVYYTDTDSLICNEKGYHRVKHLLDNDVLGLLKTEGVADFLEIRAPKDYVFGEKVTRKGIPSSAKDLGENRFKVEIWPSLGGHLREGNVATFRNKVLIKELRYNVNWGELGQDGWVKPFVISL